MSEQVAWNENDALFAQECASGYGWQMFFAGYLNAFGLNATVDPLRIRSNVSQRWGYKDGGDVLCNGHIIEVKARNEVFTSPHDFRYPNIFVDTVHNWQEKQVKPLAYACISRKTRAIIVTPGRHCAHWGTVVKTDRIRGIQDTFYTAEKHLWVGVSELIKKLTSQETNSGP